MGSSLWVSGVKAHALVAQYSQRGAPFYRVDQVGSQRVLYLNTAHRFFTAVYSDARARLRAALEVFLFVLGEAELEAIDERLAFYENERGYWSDRLRTGLEDLDQRIGLHEVPLSEPAEVEQAAM